MSLSSKALAPSEREIMNAIWDAGAPVCVNDLLGRLASSWKYTTVATFLTRLEKKGFLSREKSGERNYYSARLSRDDYRQSCASDFIDDMYGGAASEFIAHFCKGRVSEDDYDALMNILNKYL